MPLTVDGLDLCLRFFTQAPRFASPEQAVKRCRLS
jgi:hypothetical protein